MDHLVKILDVQTLTHDVRRYIVEKPPHYDFVPGQATDVSIHLPEWEDKLRPFTFTCLPEHDYLEFMIKSYADHDGVTHRLGNATPGLTLTLHDVFGAIHYTGPGVFFAGGAGITPFVSIFRDLDKRKQLTGNRLVYSNKTPADVVLDKEWQAMLGSNFIKLFTRENPRGHCQRIDARYLSENITNVSQKFYICGPDEFVKNISDHLVHMGAAPEAVVFEK
jgi:ferredoxin-NADP reductase